MDIKEICDRANRNEQIPSCLQLHDSLLFVSLRHVYQQFHEGKIDLDTAKAEKNHLLYQHRQWEKQSATHLESARRYQQITIMTEGIRADFRRQLRDGAPPEQLVNTAIKLVETWDCSRRLGVKD
jgi:ribosomal protein S4